MHRSLNVRAATHNGLMKDTQLGNIMTIMGLQIGENYEDVSRLRYGRLLIVVDQDHDGSHYKGLIVNFVSFYTMPEYEIWMKAHQNGEGYVCQYYKGVVLPKLCLVLSHSSCHIF
jgi:DNA topoisomerase-2